MIFLGQDETIKYIDVVETPRVLPTPTLDYSDNATLTGLNTLITATNMPDNATLYVNGIEKTGNTFMLTPDNTAYLNNYIYTVSVQYKKDNYTDSETVTYHYHVRNVAPIVSQDSAVVSSGGFDFSISRPDTVYTSSNDLKVMIGWLDNSHTWQTVQNPNNFIITSTVGGMTDSPIGAQYNFKVAATNYMDDSEIITRYYHNAATEYMPTPEITVSANSFLISTEYPYDPDNGFYMQSGATLYYSINGTTTSVDFSTTATPSVSVQHTIQQGDTISAYITSSTGFRTSDTSTYTEPIVYDLTGTVNDILGTDYTNVEYDSTLDSEYIETADEILYGQQA